MKFTIDIELGNDGMRTPEDVAFALKKIAQDLFRESDSHRRHMDTADSGSIYDINGNGVGIWIVKE